MLILLGIIILIVSFVIAAISMIREQAEVEDASSRGVNLKSANEGDKSSGGVLPDGEPNSEKPEAKGIDILRSRIEELARQEAADESVQPQMPGTGDPRLTAAEKEMLAQVQVPQPTGQSVIEPQVVSENKQSFSTNKQSFSTNKQSFSTNKNLSNAQNLDSRDARIKNLSNAQNLDSRDARIKQSFSSNNSGVFGAEDRFPAGEILVQELAKKKKGQQ